VECGGMKFFLTLVDRFEVYFLGFTMMEQRSLTFLKEGSSIVITGDDKLERKF
jgi:hypothetical protein